jgi:hypothetical protein
MKKKRKLKKKFNFRKALKPIDSSLHEMLRRIKRIEDAAKEE